VRDESRQAWKNTYHDPNKNVFLKGQSKKRFKSIVNENYDHIHNGQDFDVPNENIDCVLAGFAIMRIAGISSLTKRNQSWEENVQNEPCKMVGFP
jgi:hypothetical protein